MAWFSRKQGPGQLAKKTLANQTRPRSEAESKGAPWLSVS